MRTFAFFSDDKQIGHLKSSAMVKNTAAIFE